MYRTCCCAGYLTNPGGKCCMDLPHAPTVITDRIVIPPAQPTQEAKPLHSGAWQCPACGTWYAYWVSKCECQKRNMVTTGNSTNAPVTFTGVKPE